VVPAFGLLQELVMEDGISCANRSKFRWAVGGFAVFVGLFVLVAADWEASSDAAATMAIYLGLAAACLFAASRVCLNVHLSSDGLIELRYLRRNKRITAEDIYEVHFHEASGAGDRDEFRVRFLAEHSASTPSIKPNPSSKPSFA
jgi:hypothetical protein